MEDLKQYKDSEGFYTLQNVDKLLASLNYNGEMIEFIAEEYEEAVRKCDEDYLTSSRLWNDFVRKERNYNQEMEKLQKVVDQIDKEAALIGKISPIKTKLREDTLKQLNDLKAEYEMAKIGNNKAEAKALIAEYAARKNKLKEEGPQYNEYIEACKKDFNELAQIYYECKSAIDNKEKELDDTMFKSHEAYVGGRKDEVIQRNVEMYLIQDELRTLHSKYDDIIKNVEGYEYFDELIKPRALELEEKMEESKKQQPVKAQPTPTFSNEAPEPVFVMPDPDMEPLQHEPLQFKPAREGEGEIPFTEEDIALPFTEEDIALPFTEEDINNIFDIEKDDDEDKKNNNGNGSGTPSAPAEGEPNLNNSGFKPYFGNSDPVPAPKEPSKDDDEDKKNNNGNGSGTPNEPAEDEPNLNNSGFKPYFKTSATGVSPDPVVKASTKPVVDVPIFTDEERFRDRYGWMNQNNARNTGNTIDVVQNVTKKQRKHVIKEFFQARKEDFEKAKAKAAEFIESIRSMSPDMVGGRSI